MKRLNWLVWLCVVGVAVGQDPVEPVIDPVPVPVVPGPAGPVIRLPVVNDVKVEPVPVAPPEVATKLPADWLYVVESEKPLEVFAFPDGVVSWSEDEGPIRIKAKFAGGSGAVESRTFRGKYVYTFDPIAPGKVGLALVPYGFTRETRSEAARAVIEVTGLLPIPPPVDPVKPVDPVPPPVDPKDDVSKFTGPIQVLIVEYAKERRNLPPSQLNAMLSTVVREYIYKHARKTGTSYDFRLIDAGADVSKEAAWIQEGMRAPRDSVPWLLVRNEKRGASMPLPEDADRLLQVLKTFGGE